MENAIQRLNKDSAPGPDGLTTSVYQLFRSHWAPILLNVFNQTAVGFPLPDSFKFAIIKVLPKSEDAVLVKDYRPISLINTDQKIFSHLIANRIKLALQKIIGKDQIAYLQSRQIHQAINLTRLACEQMTMDSCVVALDFSKAFDSVDRDYL